MTRFINRLAIFTVIAAGMSMIFVAGVAGIWLKDRFILCLRTLDWYMPANL